MDVLKMPDEPIQYIGWTLVHIEATHLMTLHGFCFINFNTSLILFFLHIVTLPNQAKFDDCWLSCSHSCWRCLNMCEIAYTYSCVITSVEICASMILFTLTKSSLNFYFLVSLLGLTLGSGLSRLEENVWRILEHSFKKWSITYIPH